MHGQSEVAAIYNYTCDKVWYLAKARAIVSYIEQYMDNLGVSGLLYTASKPNYCLEMPSSPFNYTYSYIIQN